MTNSAAQPKTIDATAGVWNVLHAIPDPEIPVISITDLGIVRGVEWDDGKPIVTITPTYAGCPAMSMIEAMIKMELAAHGYPGAVLKTALHPAWTTDWMTDTGREKLKAYGVAPPNTGGACGTGFFDAEAPVACPHCGSKGTKQLARFGSTACKALYQCNECREPFDYFKCH